tara:strand:- start:132 stop:584 length:453 start_codon:yes stop_codon:yes gene_type:complete
MIKIMKTNLFRSFLLFGIAVLAFAILVKTGILNNPLFKDDDVKSDLSCTLTERNWNLKMDSISYSLHTNLADSLFNPIIIKQYNDILYIADYSDMKLKAFDKSGAFIMSYGDGIGRDPGEFTQILDFTILENELYTISYENGLVQAFTLN